MCLNPMSEYNHKVSTAEVHQMQIWQKNNIKLLIFLHFRFWSSVSSLYLPFDPDKIYTDVNGKQSLVLCQTHLQELIPIQLFYSLVLQILEGVGKMSLIYLLQEVIK